MENLPDWRYTKRNKQIVNAIVARLKKDLPHNWVISSIQIIRSLWNIALSDASNLVQRSG